MWPKKNNSNKKKKFEEREKLNKILELYENVDFPSEESNLEWLTLEYKRFLKEEKKLKKTWFDKLCDYSKRILPITPPKGMNKKLTDAINVCYMNTDASGVCAFTILALIFTICFSITSIFLGLDSMITALILIIGFLVSFLIFDYPEEKVKSYRIEASSEIVLSILYMVVGIKIRSTLENAVLFTAINLTGPLSYDFKKLIWDVEMKKYNNLDDGLLEYIKKWEKGNEEYAQSLHLIRSSVDAPVSKKFDILDESIKVILNGTRERMKYYTQELSSSSTLLYTIGIMLPLMCLVLIPIMVIFMPDILSPALIFMFYDVVLPIFIFWYMKRILTHRPVTFSEPDISVCKDISPKGKFKFKSKQISILPIAVSICILIVSIGAFLFITSTDSHSQTIYSIIIIWGIGSSIIIYCYLDHFQKLYIRDDIEKLENEFPEALFQLGNQLAGDIPIEIAAKKATVKIKGTKIADMFKIIVYNMTGLGMTFEESLFDKNWGAIWRYPSKLIISMFKLILESTKMGVKITSLTMMSISNYLKGMNEVKGEIIGSVNETVSSMRFMIVVLTPVICGVIVTMSSLMLDIILSMGKSFGALEITQSASPSMQSGLSGMSFLGIQGDLPISSGHFQLAVGIYLIEITIIMSMFINSLQKGKDLIGTESTISKNLLISLVSYTLVWFFTSMLFTGMMTGLI